MNVNIEIFNDTIYRFERNKKLYSLTTKSVENTTMYYEGFVSNKTPFFNTSTVSFVESLTMIPAIEKVNCGKKTAVLNFANPIEPGGGVKRGANAQEEYLCRASNLYFSLNGSSAKPFYEYHNKLLNLNGDNTCFLASDRVIYSPNITFIREDIGYMAGWEYHAMQQYTKKWKQCDVITCAAPYFEKKQYLLPEDILGQLFVCRIKQILEVAIDNDIQVLILGAFCCGAFHNPPDVVANAFRTVLLEKRYRNAFEEVIFAVKRGGWFCRNIETFEICFSQFPEMALFSTERNKRRFFE